MERLLIRLKSIEDVRRFVDVTGGFASSVELAIGNYSVDGKSIMGIFSLDLKQTVTVTIKGADSAKCAAALASFIATQA